MRNTIIFYYVQILNKINPYLQYVYAEASYFFL